MRYLVTGVNGQLGYDVCRELKERGYKYLGVDKDEMDITNPQEVEKIITEYHPDIVVHCAAYTAVDAAEDNKELCMKINVDGTRYIAEVCKKIDATMFYISTDYVFEGTGEKAWEVKDEKKPCNVYGESKYLGELEVQKLLEKYFVIRISWVFGVNGNNFIKTMLKLAETHDEINVVNDQIGSPTSTYDLSKLLVDMSETKKYGVYHATNEGYCSWYEFACEIFKIAGKQVKVNGIPTNDFPTKAVRPLNSRLNKKELDENGFHRLIDWRQSLKDFMTKIGVD